MEAEAAIYIRKAIPDYSQKDLEENLKNLGYSLTKDKCYVMVGTSDEGNKSVSILHDGVTIHADNFNMCFINPIGPVKHAMYDIVKGIKGDSGSKVRAWYPIDKEELQAKGALLAPIDESNEPSKPFLEFEGQPKDLTDLVAGIFNLKTDCLKF
jgi:hypothetical protein